MSGNLSTGVARVSSGVIRSTSRIGIEGREAYQVRERKTKALKLGSKMAAK
ncbi:hypothetical protein [Mesorhizobium waimense]|uniref:hypothetical protein n=1 Tax=Mesorhizobium waimense TaxID=1300307 RepID=UPI00142E110C|nr:hypothetical protein [Mesorhizobium waimense]